MCATSLPLNTIRLDNISFNTKDTGVPLIIYVWCKEQIEPATLYGRYHRPCRNFKVIVSSDPSIRTKGNIIRYCFS